jgi:hypothetical protein
MSGSTSFIAACKAYAQVALANLKHGESQNQLAAQAVAIGYLARMSKTDINAEARKVGGYTDSQWSIVKVPLSQAWRAVGGECGFGDKLAEMWARGEFGVSLANAYAKSAPPKKVADRIAQAVKLLITLTEAEREEVLNKVDEHLGQYAEAMESKTEKFEVLLMQAGHGDLQVKAA